MRRRTSDLRPGRVNRPIDTPLRKVREAEAELARVAATELSGTEPFRHALSAFLASARAAQKVLRRHAKDRYAAWEAALSAEDKWLSKLLSEARDLETYEDGPAMGLIVYLGGPPPAARTHHYHATDLTGTERMLPVVDLCTRQMALLREALKAVQ